MIQMLMLVALGFLAACLIALLVAPALWRQAVRRTTRRIQSRSPLTMAEIQADRDQLRAEYALSIRKLEMTVEDLRERNSRQLVENSRNEDKLVQLTQINTEQAQVVARQETEIAALAAARSQLEDDLRNATQRVEQQAEKILQQGEVIERQSRTLAENSQLIIGYEAELAELRRLNEHRSAEDRTFEMAHHALAERVAGLGRLAAKIERRRAELHDTRRELLKLQQTIAERDDVPPSQAGALRASIRGLASERDSLLDDLATAAREAERLDEEITALEVTWKARANPFDSLRSEVDAVARDAAHLAGVLAHELHLVEADTSAPAAAADAPQPKAQHATEAAPASAEESAAEQPSSESAPADSAAGAAAPDGGAADDAVQPADKGANKDADKGAAQEQAPASNVTPLKTEPDAAPAEPVHEPAGATPPAADDVSLAERIRALQSELARG